MPPSGNSVRELTAIARRARELRERQLALLERQLALEQIEKAERERQLALERIVTSVRRFFCHMKYKLFLTEKSLGMW
jgi:acyl-ACP thioesterase